MPTTAMDTVPPIHDATSRPIFKSLGSLFTCRIKRERTFSEIRRSLILSISHVHLLMVPRSERFKYPSCGSVSKICQTKKGLPSARRCNARDRGRVRRGKRPRVSDTRSLTPSSLKLVNAICVNGILSVD